jgi:putative NADPH-quinone reductase
LIMPETKTIIILQGHPDPRGGHFCHALAESYAQGAKSAGHSVVNIPIAELDFPILRTKEAFESRTLPQSLHSARDALFAADHVVLIFPLWLGTMPAILKAFLEQIMRPGIAFEYQTRGMPKKLLAGRSVRLVITMGMPAWIYRLFYGAHGVRGLRRSILSFVGMGPIRTTMIGSVETLGDKGHKKWLDKAYQAGASAS